MTSIRLHRSSGTIGLPGRRVYVALGFGIILLAAFLLRMRLVSYGSGLAASDGYDDGVYYAAADALVHGRLPYRDFLLLHPPGIVLALAPFAAFGSLVGDNIGVGVARLAFIGIGTANVALIMRLAGRHSGRAAAVAGVVAAVWFPLAYAERSTLLEPLGDLLVLAALVVSHRGGRGPVLLAGALCGLAVVVKIWYAVPLLVLVVFLPRRRVPFLAASIAAAAVAVGPFFAAAPVQLFREVVLDQLGRARMGGTGLGRRLVTMLGAPKTPAWMSPQTPFAVAVAAVVGVVLLVALVAAWRLGWPRVFVAQLLAGGAVLLASPSFFLHYAGFVGPWIAVLVGIGVAVAVDRIRVPRVRANVIALICTAVVVVNAPADLTPVAQAQPVQQLRPLLAARTGCVISDDPGLLANTDVLTRNLENDCPLWPDVTGWTYDRDKVQDSRGVLVPRSSNPVWQRHLMGYLLSGDVLVLNRPTTGLSSESRREIAGLPVIGRPGGLPVYATAG